VYKCLDFILFITFYWGCVKTRISKIWLHSRIFTNVKSKSQIINRWAILQLLLQQLLLLLLLLHAASISSTWSASSSRYSSVWTSLWVNSVSMYSVSYTTTTTTTTTTSTTTTTESTFPLFSRDREWRWRCLSSFCLCFSRFPSSLTWTAEFPSLWRWSLDGDLLRCCLCFFNDLCCLPDDALVSSSSSKT